MNFKIKKALYFFVWFLLLTSVYGYSNCEIIYSKNSYLQASPIAHQEILETPNISGEIPITSEKKLTGDCEKFNSPKNHIKFKPLDYSCNEVNSENFAKAELIFSGIGKEISLHLQNAGFFGTIFQSLHGYFLKTESNDRPINKTKIDKESEAVDSQKSQSKRFSYFSFTQIIPLITGLIIIFLSVIVFQYSDNKRLSIILLLLGGFSVRLFTALLNPNLEFWDEQFHALVAKNMMDNPFVPMLYKNPVLPFNETSWISGHVWLHKQPLFLWQMALSMKIFGVNTFALRLPSVIMSTILILFIFRIGQITIGNTAGYYSALFFSLSNFILEISAGAIHTDHNDVAFLFYIGASIWAWIEYESASNSKRKKTFLILIGVFVGCSVLVKWLTGFLVFSGWGLSVLLIKERRTKWVHYKNILTSLLVAIIIFIPWQIYIINTFPVISKYEFSLNSKHFFDVIENHGGDFLWHFNMMNEIYGIPFFLLLFFLVILIKSITNNIYKISFLTIVVIIYTFFSLAATKMVAFTLPATIILYLAIGVAFEKFLKVLILNPEYFNRKIFHVVYTTILIGVLSGFNLNIEKIQEKHTLWKKDENSMLYQRLRTTPLVKNLSKQYDLGREYIVFNSIEEDKAPIMFFNDIVAAYNQIPSQETCLNLKQKGFKIAIFDNGKLPAYIEKDSEIKKIYGYWI